MATSRRCDSHYARGSKIAGSVNSRDGPLAVRRPRYREQHP
jgi:hypothetical protein